MENKGLPEFAINPGRSLSIEEREAIGHLYPWPRPDRPLCRREDTNDKWRLGKK